LVYIAQSVRVVRIAITGADEINTRRIRFNTLHVFDGRKIRGIMVYVPRCDVGEFDIIRVLKGREFRKTADTEGG